MPVRTYELLHFPGNFAMIVNGSAGRLIDWLIDCIPTFQGIFAHFAYFIVFILLNKSGFCWRNSVKGKQVDDDLRYPKSWTTHYTFFIGIPRYYLPLDEVSVTVSIPPHPWQMSHVSECPLGSALYCLKRHPLISTFSLLGLLSDLSVRAVLSSQDSSTGCLTLA